MPQLHGQSRQQLQLIAWETFIAADNPVRVVDAFVDILDVEDLGFLIKGKSHEGRPAFSVAALLKLYFYGYLNRVRSSKQLEKVVDTNMELFWLLEEAKPRYKTIADFRKNNKKALRNTFKTFNRFLKGEGLFNGDTLAVDGTKIGVQNSKKNNYNEKKIKQYLDYRLQAAGNGFFAFCRVFLSFFKPFSPKTTRLQMIIFSNFLSLRRG